MRPYQCSWIQHQIGIRARVENAGLVMFAMLVLGAFSAPVLAGGGTWTNTLGGDWSLGSNWSSNAQPTSVDDVSFTNVANYTVSLTGNGVANIIGVDAGSVAFSLGGNTLTSSGKLRVTGTTSQVASLTLSGGTLAVSGSAISSVGTGSGGAGMLRLSGATLTLNAATYVGAEGASGILTLDSAARMTGGSWTVIGYNTGSSATLLIQSGAKLTSVSNVIGWAGGATATATVTGANSELIATTGVLDIGDGGPGGASGTLVVSNSAQASSGSYLLVGYEGGAGTLLIQSAGKVTTAGGALIGYTNGAGYASVSGANSELSITSGILDIGDFGSGTLQVSNGGRVSAAGNTIIGYSAGTGNASVSGTNSELLITGGFLDVGDQGSGSLTISDGGRVSVSGNSYIGFTLGTGRIDVSGANSRLESAATLELGKTGTGRLLISNNASVSVATHLNVYATGSLSLASGATLSVGTLDLGGDSARFAWTGGTLRINTRAPSSDGALSVPAAGTLAGNGTIDRATTVTPDGTLAPGASAGKLTFNADLTLQTSGPTHAVFQVELGGDPDVESNAGVTYDQVVVNGSGRSFVVGGATLQVIPLPTVQVNKAYQIVKVTGTATTNFANMFHNLAGGTHFEDGIYAYDVAYNTNTGITVTFSAVPEPSSAGIVALAALCLGRRRRHRVRV